MPEDNWQHSSFCAGGGNNCVEVALAGGNGIAIRESESPADIVSTNRAALKALVLGRLRKPTKHHNDGLDWHVYGVALGGYPRSCAGSGEGARCPGQGRVARLVAELHRLHSYERLWNRRCMTNGPPLSRSSPTGPRSTAPLKRSLPSESSFQWRVCN
ncbi:hypothetical protein SLUN_06175 [Streptomyces lunaelactis]|uniref:DUF397 domain-containing protein n=1 Tax=Streptomyces lunaelactis TaxID=1535768 RepID=A0A2R4SY97_9ACTN|nr:hypothetical protein SLUN_06175 [Streptomyces lunaelactis]NUK87300.1 DUF397 domain-containing protein [Streptomyces lunaelactis]NUL05963.1 DUF397 domain-containing protein [Streptomyces lunaelactis]